MFDSMSNRIVSVERVIETDENGVEIYKGLVLTIEHENTRGIKRVKKRVISLYPRRSF